MFPVPVYVSSSGFMLWVMLVGVKLKCRCRSIVTSATPEELVPRESEEPPALARAPDMAG